MISILDEARGKLCILEKYWRWSPNLKFNPKDIYQVLIRPCNVPYDAYRRFSLGMPIGYKSITHEGAVMSWYPRDPHFSYNSSFNGHNHNFKTIEEFMIYANVNNQLEPLFENWMVNDDYCKSWYAKTIDLKTNETLYDNTKLLLKKLEDDYKGKSYEHKY